MFLVPGRKTAWTAAALLLFLVPVAVLMENPLRADADLGTVIDFLKNPAIMGGLFVVVLAERKALGRPRGKTGATRQRPEPPCHASPKAGPFNGNSRTLAPERTRCLEAQPAESRPADPRKVHQA